jgi:hypothetical protein
MGTGKVDVSELWYSIAKATSCKVLPFQKEKAY